MAENGFEYKLPDESEATFYKWTASDGAKDLMLIDRFSGLPIVDFFEAISDGFELGRGPILLSLIATSMRARHPEWSVERVTRVVQNLSMSDVTFINADDEEAEETSPPVTGGAEPPKSPSLSDESGSSVTPEKTSAPDPTLSTSESSAATPV